MMSYTMACTSSCSIGGRLMRRMSPWTRIIGGRPADRCRSDALFLTAKARSSVMSIYNPWDDGEPDLLSQANRAPTGRLPRAKSIMSHYEKAWQAVLQRIQAAERAAGRTPGSVRLLAVSKTFPADAVRAVHALGQRAFGENYVQEGVAKRAQLADLPDVEWHFIGPLQSNKTAPAAAAFAWVESVDRLKIAQRLSAQRPEALPPLDVCIEVNVSGEASKGGVAPAEAPALAEGDRRASAARAARHHGHPGADGGRRPSSARQFRALRECFDALRAAGPRGRHAVDGHVGGPRGGDRRRLHAGARGHGDLWQQGVMG